MVAVLAVVVVDSAVAMVALCAVVTPVAMLVIMAAIKAASFWFRTHAQQPTAHRLTILARLAEVDWPICCRPVMQGTLILSLTHQVFITTTMGNLFRSRTFG
jgi:hypothetical protein